jgi:Ca2+-binding RTX toxin-like protein
VRISASTVPNDSAADRLTGGADRDWFVFHSGDTIIDRAADETATRL